MKKTSLVIVIGLLCILSIGYYWRYIVLPQQKETARRQAIEAFLASQTRAQLDKLATTKDIPLLTLPR